MKATIQHLDAITAEYGLNIQQVEFLGKVMASKGPKSIQVKTLRRLAQRATETGFVFDRPVEQPKQRFSIRYGAAWIVKQCRKIGA